jgi:hypothetical protein
MKYLPEIDKGSTVGTILITNRQLEKHYSRTATFFYGVCQICNKEKKLISSHVGQILLGRGTGCRCSTRSTDTEPEYKWRYQSYNQAARKRNLEWDISYQQFIDITQKNCYYCGEEPEMRPSHGKRWDFKFPMSGIDRVDSKIGYKSNNVVACCSYCNQAKWDHDVQDFLLWVRKIYTHQFQEVVVA